MGFKRLLILLILAPKLLWAGESDSLTEIKTLLWADGTQYVGETINNKRNGVGTIIWLDGSRFEGEFLDDKRHGPGVMILSDGTSYSGVFENDVLISADQGNEAPVEEEEVVTAAIDDDGQSNAIRQNVIDTIDIWARAWSNQNEELYLSMYSQGFKPSDGLSRAEWAASRTERINSPSSIEIDLSYTSFQMIRDDLIEVTFNQKYDSGGYSDETNKLLILQLEDSQWKITLEEAVTISE